MSVDQNYLECCICGRSFVKASIIKRESCFNCWSKENPYPFQIEAVDIYYYGGYQEVIKVLLKNHKNKKLIKEVSRLSKDENNEGFLKEIYYKLRNIDKSEFKKERTPKIDKKDERYYKDECPYCHKPIEFDRRGMQASSCPHCDKYIYRMYHLD